MRKIYMCKTRAEKNIVNYTIMIFNTLQLTILNLSSITSFKYFWNLHANRNNKIEPQFNYKYQIFLESSR